MNQLEILDVFLVMTAFLCLLIGLAFKWHKNHALFIFSGLIAISNVVNPFIFMVNDEMYANVGWSAVRAFDFSFSSLIHSYADSNFIFSLIVFLSLPFLILLRRKGISISNITHPSFSHADKFANQILEKQYQKQLTLLCVSLMVLYYPLFNYGIGVTGLPGELPFHLSGIVHYFRAYLIPIALVVILSKAGGNKKAVFIILLYSFVAGISAASRFVGLLPVVLLILYFVKAKKYPTVGFCFLYALFLWFAITTSRDLTFDGELHDLLEVVYYSITNISLDDILASLDLLTGRLSGAQQMVLVHQFRGHEDCIDIFNFLFGMGAVCTDTAGIIYGLDLSGTEYGLGLSLIPNIVVSSDSTLDYIFPSILVCGLILTTQYLYLKMSSEVNRTGIAGLYLFLSILFLFLGQMSFFYYLQFVILLLVTVHNVWGRLTFSRRTKLYA